jgi:hypothetical protein
MTTNVPDELQFSESAAELWSVYNASKSDQKHDCYAKLICLLHARLLDELQQGKINSNNVNVYRAAMSGLGLAPNQQAKKPEMPPIGKLSDLSDKLALLIG